MKNGAMAWPGMHGGRLLFGLVVFLVVYLGTAVESPAPPLRSDIYLYGNDIQIADNDLVPDVADGTEFGGVDLGSPASQMFVITNAGTADLTITLPISITDDFGSGTFTVITNPATTIVPSAFTTMWIEFSPAGAGAATSTVSITNNDNTGGNSSPYVFAVGGVGNAGATAPIVTNPVVEFSTITTTSAYLQAEVTADGGGAVTRGTVIGPSSDPTGGLIVNGTGLGVYSNLDISLSPGGHYYFRGWATNSAGTNYSGNVEFYAEPGEASGVNFTSVTNDRMTVNWTSGAGTGALVIVRQTDAPTGTPTDGTEHTANNVFETGGTELGDGYVVYRAVGTSVQVTNLIPTTTYHVAVFTYAGSGALINYQQDNKQTASQQTTDQESGIVKPTVANPVVAFSTITTTSAYLQAEVTADGGGAVTRGTVIGPSSDPTGGLIVNGTGLGVYSNLDISLSPGGHYYFRGWATNSAGTNYSGNVEFYAEPGEASGLNFTSVTNDSMTINWTSGAGTGALVIVRKTDAPTGSPTDGTAHNANSTFGTGGTELGDGYVVYRAVGTSVGITGLIPTTTYHVAVFTYAGSGALINYQQDNKQTASQQTTAAPLPGSTPTVANPTATAIEDTTATLGGEVTDTNGFPVTRRGIVWSTTEGFDPATGTWNSEPGSFGTGTFTRDVTGLPQSDVVYYRAFAVNLAGTSFVDQAAFQTEPTTQASAINFSSVTDTTMTVTWTVGDGDGSLVIVRPGDWTDRDPTDGTEHVADRGYGVGADLGNGNYVVYRTTGNSVDLTNLVPNTRYYVAVLAYAGSGTGIAGINYQQDLPATNSQMTVIGVGWMPHNLKYGLQCDTCHGSHGMFMATGLQQNTVCGQCHSFAGGLPSSNMVMHLKIDGSTTNVLADCGGCHDVHGGTKDLAEMRTYDAHTTSWGTNLFYVRIKKGFPTNGNPVVFHDTNSPPTDYAFTNTSPYNGVCQVCHTNTSYHRNDGTPDLTHGNGAACVSCHSHDEGFAGAGGDCLDCHGDPKGPHRAIKGEFAGTMASRHVDSATPTSNDCAVCHDEGKYPSPGSGTHGDKKVDLLNADSGDIISVPFTNFYRNVSNETLEPWVVDVQINFCLSCHDSDGATATWNQIDGTSATQPFSAMKRASVPAISNQFATVTNHHAVLQAGNNPYCIPSASNGSKITMVPPWNQDGSHDKISCFDCHGTNLHGSVNQRLLRQVNIDFDTMNALTSDPAGSPTFNTEVTAFCTLCHKAAVYVNASDPVGAGSIFPDHGASQGQHRDNELGCMGCHAGAPNLAPAGTPNTEPTTNGPGVGGIHGSDFKWPADSFSAQTNAEHFVYGGWIDGWHMYVNKGSPMAKCGGGKCNHVDGGQKYDR